MNKKILTTLILLYSTIKPAWVVPVTYVIDPLQTSVSWSISHNDFSLATGKITHVEGRIILDEEQPEASSVKALITLERNVTGISNMEAQLQTAHYFDIKKFPNASYTSDKVTVIDKSINKYRIDGTLKFKDFHKPVALNVTLNKIGIQPSTQKQTIGFHAETKLQRSELGLTNTAEMEGIGNDIAIDIQVEAAKLDVPAENN